MGYVTTEQYLGPLAKSIQHSNKDTKEPQEVITSFVEYDRHTENLIKLNSMLDGGTWDSDIANICFYGGLNNTEEESLYSVLEKARGEIQRRMVVFEQDQLTILKK